MSVSVPTFIEKLAEALWRTDSKALDTDTWPQDCMASDDYREMALTAMNVMIAHGLTPKEQ